MCWYKEYALLAASVITAYLFALVAPSTGVIVVCPVALFTHADIMMAARISPLTSFFIFALLLCFLLFIAWRHPGFEILFFRINFVEVKPRGTIDI